MLGVSILLLATIFFLNFGNVEMFRQYGAFCFSFLLVNKDADVIEHERLSNFTLGHKLS